MGRSLYLGDYIYDNRNPNTITYYQASVDPYSIKADSYNPNYSYDEHPERIQSDRRAAAGGEREKYSSQDQYYMQKGQRGAEVRGGDGAGGRQPELKTHASAGGCR